MKNMNLLLPKTSIYVLLALVSFCYNTKAQPTLTLTPVINTGLSSPIQFVNAADGTNRIFIVQKEGTIRLYDPNYNFISNFLTVTSISTSGEQGLLSLVFHPDYETNGFFFVYYANASGDLEISRYHVSSDPNFGDAATRVIVLTIPHPTNTNHNGGELHFGSDGFLYVSTGDGGGGGDVPNNAQNTSVLLGKILRLAVNTSLTAPYYSIPSGNPYSNEIYALGLRNPFRWSFDRLTNDMWIGDVGQDSYEEINYRAAASTLGANYGWRCYEGDETFNTSGCGDRSNYVFPVYNYPTQNPAASIVGGVVYRGATYPALQGYYVSADFYTGNLYLVAPNGVGGWTTTIQSAVQTTLADFGETENGELYAVSLSSNAVYRITASGTVPLTLIDFNAYAKDKITALDWQTSSENNVAQFDVEYSSNGKTFTKVGTLKALNKPTGAHYTFEHTPTEPLSNLLYRLKMIDRAGDFTYSKTISVVFNEYNKDDFIYPSIVNNKVLNFSLLESFNTLEIININGTIVYQQNMEGKIGRFDMAIKNIPTGTYFVRLKSQTKNRVQKIFVL